MRKLTNKDMAAVIGIKNNGYTIEQARVKGGEFSDSDHYGIALGKNTNGRYVTWQFHLVDELPDFYWGHYFMDNRDEAIRDYQKRE